LGSLGEGDVAAGYAPVDDLCELANAVVLRLGADVERLTADGVVGRVEEGDRRARDVLHVDQRTPR